MGIRKKAVRWMAGVLCVLLLAGLLLYDGLFAKTQVTDTAFAMGSFVQIQLTGRKRSAAQDAAACIQTVSDLDAKISNKMVASEIAKLNEETSSALSQTVVSYIERCIALSHATEGAFDITVGALSRLWNFDDALQVVPSESEITAALATVGYQNIVIQGNTVTLPAGMLLDFGAAGKGLACETAMEQMKTQGVASGVVTVGGSVGVYGAPVDVAIRAPFGTATDSFARLRFQDAVVSTSGVYEKQFEADGVQYHHILDTATGYPVQNDLISVTVICEDGLASDALATACFKLGYAHSRTALDAYDAMAVFVYRDKTVQVYNERYFFTILDTSYEKQAV